MTGLEFMKEEYGTLRAEVEASLSELATLERQCVLAAAAIYAWLATVNLTGNGAQYIWWIPVVIAVFGALRSLEAGRHLRRLSDYIMLIETEIAQQNQLAKGWEHFHAKATEESVRTIIKVVTWIVFLLGTIWAAHSGPHMKFEPKAKAQSQVDTSNRLAWTQ